MKLNPCICGGLSITGSPHRGTKQHGGSVVCDVITCARCVILPHPATQAEADELWNRLNPLPELKPDPCAICGSLPMVIPKTDGFKIWCPPVTGKHNEFFCAGHADKTTAIRMWNAAMAAAKEAAK